MTHEFQYMLHLAAIGATENFVLTGQPEIDWKKVAELAEIQKVQHYLTYALEDSNDLQCPDEIHNSLLKGYRNRLYLNLMRKSAIIRLLEEMEATGIHAVLLKGYAVADCYAVPECRTSADTDVWIDPKDEEKACEFMKARGFSIAPRWEKGHHAVCNHPRYGRVELHVILYDEIVEEVWFGEIDGMEFVREAHIQIETDYGKYYTLGYTDHLIFLALHMVKHFILSGLTVQMMLDVALYFKKNLKRIDIDRFWNTINALHYDELINCILWAMIRYCGFDESDFPGIGRENQEQMLAILDDLELGGWMGFNDKQAREEGWYEYNRQKLMQQKGKGSYFLYMLNWQLPLNKSALFPSREKLAERYPYVKKYSALVPYAWLHRLVFRGSKAIKKAALAACVVTDEESITSAGKDRVELFRKLKMM